MKKRKKRREKKKQKKRRNKKTRKKKKRNDKKLERKMKRMKLRNTKLKARTEWGGGKTCMSRGCTFVSAAIHQNMVRSAYLLMNIFKKQEPLKKSG